MQITYKTGDLLRGPERFIAHGCNAQGVMRSGIAGQIVDVFPQAFEHYRQTYEGNGRHLDLGTTQWVNCGNKIVINVITQEFYGRDPNRRYVSYEAVRRGLKQINAHAHFSQRIEEMENSQGEMTEVGFPLIGAGLANGSWAVISAIIEEEARNFKPVVYLRDGVIPKS